MVFLGRAYYNLLLLGLSDEDVKDVKDWETKDYRGLKISELVKELESLGVSFDLDAFLELTEGFDSPEDFHETLLSQIKDEEISNRTYLVIFELWRRLCKDKESLSIFCDSLDYQLEAFERLGDEGELLEMLKDLEDILDQSVDEGENPKEMFELVSAYLAHNLEDALYEFASFQIDKGNAIYASELVDGYYEYVENVNWFEFLRVRLVAIADPKEATVMMQHLLEDIQDQPDLDLIYEALRYLTYTEEVPLFYHVFEIAVHLVQTESDFKELLHICLNYLNSLDCDDEEILVQKIIEKRAQISETVEINMADEDLLKVKEIVSSVPS